MTRQDQALALLRHLFDPRGRADRRAMLAATLGLLVAQAAVAALFVALGGNLKGNLFFALNAALFWVGGVVLVKRLHDIGWAGWWIAPAVVFWVIGFLMLVLALGFAVGFDRFDAVLKANPLWLAGLTGIGMIPPFGGLLWLQASPGSVGVNRFGPAPGPQGFAPGHTSAAPDNVPHAVTA